MREILHAWRDFLHWSGRFYMLAGRAGEIVSRRETPSQCGRVGSPVILHLCTHNTIWSPTVSLYGIIWTRKLFYDKIFFPHRFDTLTLLRMTQARIQRGAAGLPPPPAKKKRGERRERKEKKRKEKKKKRGKRTIKKLRRHNLLFRANIGLGLHWPMGWVLPTQ